jgi:hypothetical protein
LDTAARAALQRAARLARLPRDMTPRIAPAAADRHRMVLAWAFARLDVVAFAAASAVVFALALGALTLALVVKGAPPGQPVGPHLGALAAYFPGYAVTYAGAAIGAAYATLVGAACGAIVAALWNFAHALLLAVIRMRANLASFPLD